MYNSWIMPVASTPIYLAFGKWGESEGSYNGSSAGHGSPWVWQVISVDSSKKSRSSYILQITLPRTEQKPSCSTFSR